MTWLKVVASIVLIGAIWAFVVLFLNYTLSG